LMEIFLLLVAIGGGVLLYGLVLYGLGLPELQLIVDHFRKKISGITRP
jgi:hypothetical protein